MGYQLEMSCLAGSVSLGALRAPAGKPAVFLRTALPDIVRPTG